MSMNTCFECYDVYDTDNELETNDRGDMICNKCAEKELEMIERLSEKVHHAYCQNHFDRTKKDYWTKGDYGLLTNEAKEIDRATVRAVLREMKKIGYFHKDEIMRIKIPQGSVTPNKGRI